MLLKFIIIIIVEKKLVAPPPELSRALSVYFHHLYGMFPCNLMAFLRQQCMEDQDFLRLIQVLITIIITIHYYELES